MKAKYFFLYLLLGAAFLAVSLWVFLSGGRSARAVNAKFRLGGLLLSTWAMLTAVSCQGNFPPTVTCYEPMVECYDVYIPENEVSVRVKDSEEMNVKPGDVLVVSIQYRTHVHYYLQIRGGIDGSAPVLQEAYLTFPENLEADGSCEVTLAETEYKGKARIFLSGVTFNEDGSESGQYPVSEFADINIQ